MPSALYLPKGENSKIKVMYSGDQPMEAFLEKEKRQVSTSDHIKYIVFDDYVVIFIREVNSDDAGSYSLTVKNDSGSATGNCQIYITGIFNYLKKTNTLSNIFLTSLLSTRTF